MVKNLMLGVVAALFIFQSPALAQQANISHMVANKDVIKAYITGFTNESGQTHIQPDEFKNAVKKALSERKSVKFEIVDDSASSDVHISGVIKKYQYLNRGPMKFSPGLETMALDAAASATMNYVEMEVEFTVTDAKTNEVIWKDIINDYIKEVMTPAESIPMIFDKVSRVFLWRSFGKRK